MLIGAVIDSTRNECRVVFAPSNPSSLSFSLSHIGAINRTVTKEHRGTKFYF